MLFGEGKQAEGGWHLEWRKMWQGSVKMEIFSVLVIREDDADPAQEPSRLCSLWCFIVGCWLEHFTDSIRYFSKFVWFFYSFLLFFFFLTKYSF